MTDDLCLTCEHYIEETDDCDVVGNLRDRRPLNWCKFYEFKDEVGHIYPWQHSLLG